MQKKAMNATFCLLPMSFSRTIEIGSSAGGGIARQYSMCGIASLRVQRESPIGIPSATPATTAIPNPRPIRTRLGTTWVVNCENSHMSWNSTRIVDSLGKLGLSAWTVHSCQTTRIASGTSTSAPIATPL